MKTESEIRKHRDALRIVERQPCDCRGVDHIKCVIGGKMMLANIRLLSWILGEDEDYERTVENLDVISKQ